MWPVERNTPLLSPLMVPSSPLAMEGGRRSSTTSRRGVVVVVVLGREEVIWIE